MDSIDQPNEKSKHEVADDAGPFRRYAETLLANGYSPIPTQRKNSKMPFETGWQQRCKQAIPFGHIGLDGRPIDDQCQLGVACGYQGLIALDFDGSVWTNDFV